MANPRIKVMVVDDSAVVRQVVAGLLDADPDIEVIAAVADPLLAISPLNSSASRSARMEQAAARIRHAEPAK